MTFSMFGGSTLVLQKKKHFEQLSDINNEIEFKKKKLEQE